MAHRQLIDPIHLAIDMLMTQAYKAHLSVRLLAEHAHVEDAATITRRLLELAVQTVYIGEESESDERLSRAGQYLAHLWENAPDKLKDQVPPDGRSRWEDISKTYYQPTEKKKRRWGPTFAQMFEAAGVSDIYEEDYSLLSSVSHGSSEESLLVYSYPTVRVRSDLHVPVLLSYATKYYLVVTHTWNGLFSAIPESRMTELREIAIGLTEKDPDAAA